MPKKKIEKLLARHGLKVDWEAHKSETWVMDTYIWNPETNTINPDSYTNVESNALHELAHWLLASPRRRKHPSFGLGHPPCGKDYPLRFLSRDSAQREEELVSVLGILMEKTFRLPWKDTYEDHSWGDGVDSDQKFTRRVRTLQRKGLIDANEVPTCITEVFGSRS